MVNERIESLITHFCKGNKSLFAKQIGVTPSVIGNITGERKGNPSFEVAQKILDAFASVDANWLMLGRGHMLNEIKEEQPSEPISAPSDTVTLRLMDKLDKKESQIDQLQSELRAMEKELATYKAKYPEETANPPKVLSSSETAPHAPSHPHSPTSEYYHGSSLPPHQENQ